MKPTQRAPPSNRLLEALPATDRRRFLAASEHVELVFSAVLYSPGNRIDHVYFPLMGFISLIMPVDDTESLEVGLIGNEGMFGVPLVLGVNDSPTRAVVQGTGSALTWGPPTSWANSYAARRCDAR